MAPSGGKKESSGSPASQRDQNARSLAPGNFEEQLRGMILGHSSHQSSQPVNVEKLPPPQNQANSIFSLQPVSTAHSANRQHKADTRSSRGPSGGTGQRGKPARPWKNDSSDQAHARAIASLKLNESNPLPFSVKAPKPTRNRRRQDKQPPGFQDPNNRQDDTTSLSNKAEITSWTHMSEIRPTYNSTGIRSSGQTPQPSQSNPIPSHQISEQSQSHQSNNWSQNQSYHQYSSMGTSQPLSLDHSAYGRPPPQQRQLYDHHQEQRYNSHQFKSQVEGQNRLDTFQSSLQAQINYLDALARDEVHKAAITVEEEQQKECVRRALEEIFQKVVTEYELVKDPLFGGSTVTLKCFGSLRSGFATRSSDMDLALESPLSKPSPSSTESEIPRLLEKELLELGYGARLLTRTRVPIIRFCEKPTPELASLLRGERMKWEKEKDAPPKAKKGARAKRCGTPKSGHAKPENEQKEDGCSQSADLADVERTDCGHQNDKGKYKNEHQDGELKQHTLVTETYPAVRSAVKSNSSRSGPNSSDLGEINVEHHPESSVPQSDSLLTKSEDRCVSSSGEKDENLHCDQVTQTFDRIAREGVPSEPTTMGAILEAEISKPQVPTESLKRERREDVLPDLELVRLYNLAMKEGWFEPSERLIIHAFIKAVEDPSDGEFGSNRNTCRSKLVTLPDVLNRYRPPPEHHLDFPKTGVGVQCDINFSNALALHNSAMLRCYCLSDYRVKPMVLFVKSWASRRNINSPYHGTLSSYGYVLMVLHYLVNVTKPPICLNLQTTDMALRDNCTENLRPVEGRNVRFWRNEIEIQRWAHNGFITIDHQSSVGSLLRGFFQYFAVNGGGFSWGMDVLSLRTPGGILTKKQKDWIAAKTVVVEPSKEGQRAQEIRHRYLFAIEDPFEIDHNIARTVVHNGIVAIRDEFRRAHRIIQMAGNGNFGEDLIQEAESKTDLNYRHFGPRPKAPETNVPAGRAPPSKGGNNQGSDPNPKISSNESARQDQMASRNMSNPEEAT